ncbi:MAG: HPF/RaiA family ribosome-associated protein [Phycisphaerales bacterium]|nr:HPF/RaiA family ribosome-associated protein [Phycisphaerales bacterium]
MRIEVHDGPMKSTPAFLTFINDRLTVALDRFSPRVAAVYVKVEDANGPRGGSDKQCALRARLHRGGVIMAREHDTDYYSAFDRAISKLKLALAKEVDRKKRSVHRGR